MLRLANVTKSLGAFRLDVDQLIVETGGYFVLLGPSGAGKTVLLSLIAGLQPVDGGSILLRDRDVTHLPPEQRCVGYVGQKPHLFPNLSVRDNIRFGLRYQPSRRDALARRADDCVAMLRLQSLLDRGVRGLSGGETQRVAIARALTVEPELLLLDEPFALLDHNARDAFREQLKQLHRALGTTTVHVTHDRQEALALADHAGVIADGSLLQSGEVRDLFWRPQREFVARFLGVDNVLAAHATPEGADRVRLDVAGFTLRAGSRLAGPVRACIRPEAIRIGPPAEAPAPEQNAVPGRLTRLTEVGSEVRATLSADGLELTARLSSRELRETGLSVGDRALALFRHTDVHVFRADNLPRPESA